MIDPLQSQDQGEVAPLVTVAMPVFNAGKYLRLAVLSIVNQTFTGWELLIFDDGSTDNALQDIADINDARIRILRDSNNRGLAVRLNECIDLARGKYFARMDSDDVSFPERLARQVEALQNDPKLDLVAARAITIDENSTATGLFPYSLSHDEICARPWRGFYFPHPTWLGKIEWFRKYCYTVPAPYFCEDQELLLRSHRESRFGTIGEVLFGYRISGKTNWQKLAKTRRTILKMQLRHFMEKHQWRFALLAAAFFVAKLSSDLLKRILGFTFHSGRDIVDDSVLIKWNKILGGLMTVSKIP